VIRNQNTSLPTLPNFIRSASTTAKPNNMRTTLVIASLFASLALSKPLHERLHGKRSYVVVEDIETVTKTVTGSSGSGWQWGEWGWHGSSSPTTSSESDAVPVVTETPLAPTIPVVTETMTMPAATPTPAAVQPSTAAASAWPTSAPTAAPSTGAIASQGNFPIQPVLDQHNNHRGNSSAAPLVWDENLANIALEIAQSCVYAHNTQAGGGGYGQNIGAGVGQLDIPAMVTNEMYNGEINSYPLPYGVEPDMSDFESWGHYSQIVWKSTTSVGCAWVDCGSQGLSGVGSGVSPTFVVCNYSPPGNFGGEYGANVGSPEGQPSANVVNS